VDSEESRENEKCQPKCLRASASIRCHDWAYSSFPSNQERAVIRD
jgi:hypothetical protein